MTIERAESLLSAAMIESAKVAGREYGEQEAELLADQGIDPTSEEFSRGQWAGGVPDEVERLDSECESAVEEGQVIAEYESILDDAAAEAFYNFDLADYRKRNPNASA